MGEGTLTARAHTRRPQLMRPVPPPIQVESRGGPLIVIPLPRWPRNAGLRRLGHPARCHRSGRPRPRLCDGRSGRCDHRGRERRPTLVLADEPATICCLPERRTFLRWSAAESEATADAVLAGLYTESEECGTWVSDGSAMLTDFAEADSELDTECPYLGRMPTQTRSCCLPAAGGPGPPISRQVRTTASV